MRCRYRDWAIVVDFLYQVIGQCHTTYTLGGARGTWSEASIAMTIIATLQSGHINALLT
jgi:hypothetical protein